MSLKKARGVVASLAEVEGAADELLSRGNAVDAVVAGVWAACALSPGVLLGPVQILVGGAGAGFLAVDGRVRQPGVSAPRPRGFVKVEEIPDAARIGVPWLPATLSVALATMGSATFSACLGPALAFAKDTPRHDVLKRIQSRGARAFEDDALGGELLAHAGRTAGGLLTKEDLRSPQPDVQKAGRLVLAGGESRAASARTGRAISLATEMKRGEGPKTMYVLPWARIEDDRPVAPKHEVEVARARSVIAVDRNGTFAIATWEEATSGIMLGDLGLRAPFHAEPVRRGQTRIKPGEIRPAPSPIALVGAEAAPVLAFAAFGASDAYDVLGQAITSFTTEDRIEAHGEARLVALAHASGTATVLRG